MAHEEKVYQNPDNFDPTRFLPKPSGNGEPHLSTAFGFGRRLVMHSHLRMSYKNWTILSA